MESKQNLNEVLRKPMLTSIEGSTWEERRQEYIRETGYEPELIPEYLIGHTPEDFIDECKECKECYGD